MKLLITTARDWYGRNERPVSSLSLVGGFIFEWFALKRIDLFWENLWVAAHFFIIAFLIILVNFHANETHDHKDASKLHFWYLTFLQGFFGGMLSTFLVFYFRSAEIAVSWPFLLLLSVAFIANESFKKHYIRLVFQISLFYLSLLTFAIYIVPVFFHRIGPDVFLISGLVSLAVLFFFMFGIRFFAKEKFKESKKLLATAVFSIFFVTNILYFLNLIPPLPLSLKDAGIYHSLYRNTSGNYVVESENTGRQNFFAWSEDFHLVSGDPIYAYTAIFSPAAFNTDIVHEWQKYDQNVGGWVTATRINLSAQGGRDAGYRIYSMKNNITPGEWRVNVLTSQGQIIGRLRFNIIFTNQEPVLKTHVL
ncbi:MAG: DUF2914 domain-containing protein [bacterium]|nr:DUF2914 domain-containing protein [bacterium]